MINDELGICVMEIFKDSLNSDEDSDERLVKKDVRLEIICSEFGYVPRTLAGVDVDTLTMEQYLALSRENQASGVVKPEIRGNVNFEIKSQFMRELREDTFSRNKDEDSHDHIDRALSIVDLFNIPGVSKDAVVLRVFPFTLIGSTKRQEGDESLYQAWEWYNDLLYKYPTYDINNHQKINIFYKGLSTMNRQLLDSQRPILEMIPTQALTAIQTIADHSQKRHDGTTTRNIRSSSSNDRLAALVNKLDNLGRDMKKLKKSVIQSRLDAKFVKDLTSTRIIPSTRKLNKLKRRQSLEELLAKHQEESARRSTEMEIWIKNLQENAEINTRNQNASFKNLQNQIEQLTEKLHSRMEKSEQTKVVIVKHEGLNSPKKHKNLHGISFLSDSHEENTNDQLPTKESNPGHFTLPYTIGNFNFYAMANLGASVNVLPRNIFEYIGN
ncbi:hypothetical protein Tco_0328242 [Tanacetum coccineum]